MEVFAEGLEIFEVSVAAPAGHAADVPVGHADDAHVVRNLGAFLEDALTAVAEIVHRHGEAVAEEVEIHTDVEFLGFLPRQVVGAHAVLGQYARTAPRRAVGLLFDDRQVGEAHAGNPVVTHHTVRGADLHEVDPLDPLHEFVLRGNPAHGHGREESVLPAALEVLRTVQAEVHVEEIGILEAVGEAPREALVTPCDGVHRTVGTRFGRAFQVVEQQAAYAVVSEGAVVVDFGVEIEFPPVPCLGVILHRSLGDLFRKDQLAFLVTLACQVEGRHGVAAFAVERLGIPRTGGLDVQPFGEHRQILFYADVEERAAFVLHGVARVVEQHVGRDVAVRTRGGQLAARIAQRVHQRGRLGLRIPDPVGERRVGAAVLLTHARTLVHRHEAHGTQVDLRRLGQVDVDVGAEIIGVVADALVVFAVVHALVGRRFLRHAQAGEIAGDVAAALCTDILRVLERGGVEDHVLPVDVGVEVGIQPVADDVHLRVVVDRAHARGYGCFVRHFGILRGTHVAGQAAQLGDGVVRAEGDFELLLFSALGGHEHHAVRTAAAVDGRCGGVLEHREALDVGRVDLAQVAFQSVDQHQGAAVGAERADAAHPEFGDVPPRLTARLDGNHARDAAAERVDDIRRGQFEVFGVDHRHGARHADFALRTHTDDDDLFHLVAFPEGDLDVGRRSDDLFGGFVPHERYGQRIVHFGGEFEPAFRIGDGADARLVLDIDRGADDGDVVRIHDQSVHLDRLLLLLFALGTCLYREREQEGAYH